MGLRPLEHPRSTLVSLLLRRMPSLVVNGQSTSVPPQATVAQLVEQLGHTGKRIAVERNGEIVPKSLHGSTVLAEGDRLEIVVAVGGG
jgi:sulfur carrier protein